MKLQQVFLQGLQKLSSKSIQVPFLKLWRVDTFRLHPYFNNCSCFEVKARLKCDLRSILVPRQTTVLAEVQLICSDTK